MILKIKSVNDLDPQIILKYNLVVFDCIAGWAKTLFFMVCYAYKYHYRAATHSLVRDKELKDIKALSYDTIASLFESTDSDKFYGKPPTAELLRENGITVFDEIGLVPSDRMLGALGVCMNTDGQVSVWLGDRHQIGRDTKIWDALDVIKDSDKVLYIEGTYSMRAADNETQELYSELRYNSSTDGDTLAILYKYNVDIAAFDYDEFIGLGLHNDDRVFCCFNDTLEKYMQILAYEGDLENIRCNHDGIRDKVPKVKGCYLATAKGYGAKDINRPVNFSSAYVQQGVERPECWVFVFENELYRCQSEWYVAATRTRSVKNLHIRIVRRTFWSRAKQTKGVVIASDKLVIMGEMMVPLKEDDDFIWFDIEDKRYLKMLAEIEVNNLDAAYHYDTNKIIVNNKLVRFGNYEKVKDNRVVLGEGTILSALEYSNLFEDEAYMLTERFQEFKRIQLHTKNAIDNHFTIDLNNAYATILAEEELPLAGTISYEKGHTNFYRCWDCYPVKEGFVLEQHIDLIKEMFPDSKFVFAFSMEFRKQEANKYFQMKLDSNPNHLKGAHWGKLMSPGMVYDENGIYKRHDVNQTPLAITISSHIVYKLLTIAKVLGKRPEDMSFHIDSCKCDLTDEEIDKFIADMENTGISYKIEDNRLKVLNKNQLAIALTDDIDRVKRANLRKKHSKWRHCIAIKGEKKPRDTSGYHCKHSTWVHKYGTNRYDKEKHKYENVLTSYTINSIDWRLSNSNRPMVVVMLDCQEFYLLEDTENGLKDLDRISVAACGRHYDNWELMAEQCVGKTVRALIGFDNNFAKIRIIEEDFTNGNSTEE